MWHVCLTLTLVCSEWNTDAVRFYRPLGCLPLVCFLNVASSGGHAHSREKIEFPLPNSELWQHVTSTLHILRTALFSCVCDKWAIVFLLRFPLSVTKDVLHMTPPPSQAPTFFIKGPLLLLVIVFSSFFPQKTLSLLSHQIMTKRAGHWFQTHLAMTFSNPKYFTGCQLDVNRLIDSLKSWESTRMSLPLTLPMDNFAFYLVFIATAHWIMKHLPSNCQLHKEWSG